MPAGSIGRTCKRGLGILDRNQGEIWAKLDAGTEEYFRSVDRSPIPSQVLENITQAARIRPLVIQSLWMRIRGEPPPQEIQLFASGCAKSSPPAADSV